MLSLIDARPAGKHSEHLFGRLVGAHMWQAPTCGRCLTHVVFHLPCSRLHPTLALLHRLLLRLLDRLLHSHVPRPAWPECRFLHSMLLKGTVVRAAMPSRSCCNAQSVVFSPSPRSFTLISFIIIYSKFSKHFLKPLKPMNLLQDLLIC